MSHKIMVESSGMSRNVTAESLEFNLTPKQETAIVALLEKASLADAADHAKVNRRTLWRWLQEPDFQKAYRDARHASVKNAIANLQRASGEAVAALCEVMKDQAAKGSERVSAAKAVLEFAIKAVEVEDLTARVEELENLNKG